MESDVIERLWGIILERKQNHREGSYTRKMIDEPEMLHGKIMEEASEVVEASRKSSFSGKDSLSWEAADLLYHLMVLFAAKDQEFSDVLSELESRMK